MLMQHEYEENNKTMSPHEEWLVWASLHKDLETVYGGKLEIESPIYELLISDPVTRQWIASGKIRKSLLSAFPQICWLNLLHPVLQRAIAQRHYCTRDVLGFCSEWVLDTSYYEQLSKMHIRALLLSGVISFQRYVTLVRFQRKMLNSSRDLCRQLLSGRMTMPEFLRISPMEADQLLETLVVPVSLL